MKTHKRRSVIRLLKIACLLLIPVALIALSVTLYTLYRARDDQQEQLDALLDYQTEQLDRGCQQVYYNIAAALATDPNVRSLQAHSDGLLAPYWMNATLTTLSQLQSLVNPGWSFYIGYERMGIGGASRSALDEYGENHAVEQLLLTEGGFFTATVQSRIVTVGGSPWLVVAGENRGVRIAGWCRLENLFSFMDSVVPPEKGYYLLVDADFEPLTGGSLFYDKGFTLSDGEVRGDTGRALTAYRQTGMGAGLIAVSRRTPDPGSAGIFVLSVLVLCGITAGACFYLIYYFRRHIQQPIDALRRDVTRYAGERRFTRRYGIAELDDVADAFNGLEEQVGALKIDIYEEKLRRTRTELEFLQNQIKPHFFVNCFNIIIGMAEWEKFDQIQNFCMLLASYVRYTLRDGLETVTLREELRETADFLAIQDIRFDSHTTLQDFEAEELLDCRLPPLVLLTLAENSVRHNKFKVDALRLTVQAAHLPGGLHGLLRLDYADNGVGLTPQETRALTDNLRAVRESALAGGENFPSDGRHIGLQNVYRRLILLYGERASIDVMPADREGFRLRIILPIDRRLK